MKRSDLIKAVAEKAGISQKDVKSVLDGLETVLVSQVATDDRIDIGFASVQVVDKPARTGRNPMTGATIEIAAHKAVKIKPAKVLKDAVGV